MKTQCSQKKKKKKDLEELTNKQTVSDEQHNNWNEKYTRRNQ